MLRDNPSSFTIDYQLLHDILRETARRYHIFIKRHERAEVIPLHKIVSKLEDISLDESDIQSKSPLKSKLMLLVADLDPDLETDQPHILLLMHALLHFSGRVLQMTLLEVMAGRMGAPAVSKDSMMQASDAIYGHDSYSSTLGKINSKFVLETMRQLSKNACDEIVPKDISSKIEPLYRQFIEDGCGLAFYYLFLFDLGIDYPLLKEIVLKSTTEYLDIARFTPFNNLSCIGLSGPEGKTKALQLTELITPLNPILPFHQTKMVILLHALFSSGVSTLNQVLLRNIAALNLKHSLAEGFEKIFGNKAYRCSVRWIMQEDCNNQTLREIDRQLDNHFSYTQCDQRAKRVCDKLLDESFKKQYNLIFSEFPDACMILKDYIKLLKPKATAPEIRGFVYNQQPTNLFTRLPLDLKEEFVFTYLGIKKK